MPNLLSRIAERFKPVRRQDPIFGSMLYMGDKLGYWEGRTKFPPTNYQIEVFVDGSREDSMERQHLFFEKVCHEWLQLREAIAPQIREAYVQVTMETLTTELWDEFTVTSISIPAADLESTEWTIGLDAKSDDGHSYFVEMQGRVPRIVSWDS
jgi:hypothetical protein